MLALRIRKPQGCDPACGDGQFLLEALRRLWDGVEESAAAAVSLVYGVDVDSLAVEIARFNLARAVRFCSASLPIIARNIRVGNALLGGWTRSRLLGNRERVESERVEVWSAEKAALEHGHRAFHWELEYPEVFREQGGFNLIIGNPPWEKLEMLVREYFAAEAPEIEFQGGTKARRFLDELKRWRPQLHERYRDAQAALESLRVFV